MGFWDFFKSKPKLESSIHCVPAAIAAAWAWQGKYRQECRMAVQKVKPGIDHVQAQACIDGVWSPLVIYSTDRGLVARPGKPHFDILPYRYVSLEDWIDDQLQYVRLEKQ